MPAPITITRVFTASAGAMPPEKFPFKVKLYGAGGGGGGDGVSPYTGGGGAGGGFRYINVNDPAKRESHYDILPGQGGGPGSEGSASTIRTYAALYTTESPGGGPAGDFSAGSSLDPGDFPNELGDVIFEKRGGFGGFGKEELLDNTLGAGGGACGGYFAESAENGADSTLGGVGGGGNLSDTLAGAGGSGSIGDGETGSLYGGGGAGGGYDTGPYTGGYGANGLVILIYEDVTLADSLFAHWNLDEEASAEVWVDATGNGNNLVRSGTVESSAGIFGNALTFTSSHPTSGLAESVSQKIVFADTYTGLPYSFTISAWLQVKSKSNEIWNGRWGAGFDRDIIFGWHPTTGWSLQYNDLATTLPVTHGTGTPGDYNVDTWYHVVFSYLITQTVTLDIYVNGELKFSNEVERYGATGPSAIFMLGNAAPGAGIDWQGKIEHVSIWHRALTSVEVGYLYNSGNGLSYSEMTGTGSAPPGVGLGVGKIIGG